MTRATVRSESAERVTFSFGRNWLSFVRSLRPEDVKRAQEDIERLLPGAVAGKTVVDVGCGSGIHSLSFLRLGAGRVLSLDVDPASVKATRLLWGAEGSPSGWEIREGSILDPAFTRDLGRFDIVYSWGVLHHTGQLANAIGRASDLVAPEGRLLISIYARGPNYENHLALKRAYNRASFLGKRLMIAREIKEIMVGRWRAGMNPLRWNQKKERGMNVYHDLVDWLGGLPYEVASPEEVKLAASNQGLALERLYEAPEGGCSVYLFSGSRNR
jgi:2-polyprenyl-6-hydroxyphenyl methylase/3-demethylubiquinone-9 3-methyltransferase